MEQPPLNRRSREAMATAFEARVHESVLRRMRDSFASQDFWRRFAPDAAITDTPFANGPERRIAADDVRECAETLALDGYFVSPPVVRSPEVDQVVRITRQMHEYGYPVAFAAIYDAFWRLFQGLDTLLVPILGEGYLLLPNTPWMHYLPPGSGVGPWLAAAPHRDAYGPDMHLLASGRPGIVNLWIALTDATPLNSCIYVLPAGADDDYLTTVRSAPADISLTDVRALPAAAGSVLGWTTHLAIASSPLA